jgi:hypothetical protein
LGLEDAADIGSRLAYSPEQVYQISATGHCMTTWEYAYLHSIPYSRQDARTRAYVHLTIYVVEEAANVWVLDKVNGFLDSLNIVGAEGWHVQLPSSGRHTDKDREIARLVHVHVPEILEDHAVIRATNFMRRSRD